MLPPKPKIGLIVATGLGAVGGMFAGATPVYATSASETINPAAGALTLSAPATVAFPAVTLTNVNQSVTSTQSFDVSDLTGSGLGWNVTGTSTAFVNGSSQYLSNTSTTESHAAFACTGASSCTLPSDGIGAYALPAAQGTAPAATKMLQANANSGMGDANTSATFSLSVPSNALAGSYTSTWTFSVTSGP